jgi:hypothetical protein
MLTLAAFELFEAEGVPKRDVPNEPLSLTW